MRNRCSISTPTPTITIICELQRNHRPGRLYGDLAQRLFGDPLGRGSGVAPRAIAARSRHSHRCCGILPVTINGIRQPPSRPTGGSRVPDIVAISASTSPGRGAADGSRHQNDASLFGASALTTPAATVAPSTPAMPTGLTSNSYGFASGRHSAERRLSLAGRQTLLEPLMKKAPLVILPVTILGSIMRGQSERYAGSGFIRRITAPAERAANSDCVFTGSGSCEQQSAGHHRRLQALLAPDIGLGCLWLLYGSALFRRCADWFGGGVGISNIKEGRIAPISCGRRSRASISALNSCTCI